MGCGASLEALAGGGSEDTETATKQLRPISLKPLGLPSFDEVFDLATDCFSTLTRCNGKMYELVNGLMKATGKLNLLDAISDAVIQARAAIDPYMPDDIDEIREKIKSSPASAASSIAEAMSDLKELLPEIDTSGLSSGDMTMEMPTMMLDKCPQAAKEMMQMIIDLAQALVECAAEGIKTTRPRVDDCVEMVSGLSVGKLTDELKSSGMGMGEMMSKPGEFKDNVTEVGKLKEYAQVVAAQVKVIATGLGAGYKAAVEFIVGNAPSS